MRSPDGLRVCSRKCAELKTPCPIQECRHWINYPVDYNCSLVSIYNNGSMTLRQIAERLHLSFARIKQIETKALAKIKKRALNSNLFF
jgi:hypothetical protein